jgi:probable rRNA maturation factor
MNRIAVISLEKKFKKSEGEIKQSARDSLSRLGKDGFFLEIYLVGNREIRFLNGKFRGKNKVTNVLSFTASPEFPFVGADKKLRPLGEIYLAPDYLEKRGDDPVFLVVHGILHLLGYTHETRRDRIRMEKAEDRVFSAIS